MVTQVGAGQWPSVYTASLESRALPPVKTISTTKNQEYWCDWRDFKRTKRVADGVCRRGPSGAMRPGHAESITEGVAWRTRAGGASQPVPAGRRAGFTAFSITKGDNRRTCCTKEGSGTASLPLPLYEHTFWIQDRGFTFMSAYGTLTTCILFSTLCGRDGRSGAGLTMGQQRPHRARGHREQRGLLLLTLQIRANCTTYKWGLVASLGTRPQSPSSPTTRPQGKGHSLLTLRATAQHPA